MSAADDDRSEHFDTQLHGQVLEVKFISPQLFEHLVMNEVDDELNAAVRRHQPRHIVFDFASVEFCSTSIINALLAVRRQVTRDGGEVALADLQTTVRRAFRVLNLDTVFLVCPSVDEALAELRRRDEGEDTSDEPLKPEQDGGNDE